MDWWRGSNLGWCCSAHKAKGVKPQPVRRRNRAKHVEIARAEIAQATSHPHVEEVEYEACSDDVWLALNENERNLMSLNFDGVYTV